MSGRTYDSAVCVTASEGAAIGVMGRADDEQDFRGFDSYEIRLGDHLRGERATKGKSLLDVQRELRIRASYIAAIENADLAVFTNHGFVAGYVRSYARYLNLDPDLVFRRFCEESGFDGVNAGLQTRKAASSGRIVQSGPLRVKEDDPLLRPIRTPAADLRPGMLERMSLSAIGSVMVLAVLTGTVAYGGYRVLQNIQRVTIAPVDQRPETLSSVAELAAPGYDVQEVQFAEAGAPAAPPQADADLARLYRPRELEIPVVEARDGPIVEIDPTRSGLFADARVHADEAEQVAALVAAAMAQDPQPEPVVREPVGAPVVNVTARQPAWVRVYTEAGTVLFEKILDPGETYTLPLDVEAPLLRAGNSGSVYLLVNDQAYGPLGTATSVAKKVSLMPDDIREAYPPVSDPPEVVQATLSALNLEAPQQ